MLAIWPSHVIKARRFLDSFPPLSGQDREAARAPADHRCSHLNPRSQESLVRANATLSPLLPLSLLHETVHTFHHVLERPPTLCRALHRCRYVLLNKTSLCGTHSPVEETDDYVNDQRSNNVKETYMPIGHMGGGRPGSGGHTRSVSDTLTSPLLNANLRAFALVAPLPGMLSSSYLHDSLPCYV